MTGKQKCAILKEIRRDIAAKNDISIRIEECTHKGECRGTCPRCEAEVRILERALEEKKKRGLRTAIAGVSAGILAASLASCVPVSGEQFTGNGTHSSGVTELEGDVAVIDETAEAERTEGEIALPDPENENDPEDYEVTEGEPPVCDYEFSAEEEYPPVAGIMPAPDYTEEIEP
ncbi:MAG: hypothetical protein IKZ41_10530 [Clostridia bacterium]|nr:hypothetical protein [Clostridia bacterium]MBR5366665.1 hypothetical protein [Clostridia bacterium]